MMEVGKTIFDGLTYLNVAMRLIPLVNRYFKIIGEYK